VHFGTARPGRPERSRDADADAALHRARSRRLSIDLSPPLLLSIPFLRNPFRYKRSQIPLAETQAHKLMRPFSTPIHFNSSHPTPFLFASNYISKITTPSPSPSRPFSFCIPSGSPSSPSENLLYTCRGFCTFLSFLTQVPSGTPRLLRPTQEASLRHLCTRDEDPCWFQRATG
jgi:hypothetical protein